MHVAILKTIKKNLKQRHIVKKPIEIIKLNKKYVQMKAGERKKYIKWKRGEKW